ncbi:hypothetical protein GCM10008985_05130 [Halococcus dombrowskii]|uniref:Uncharacterized protein n=1 Tax=Halococcus dombrowskii TaxID=179637 RepID=A0AAV3SC19_HALDO
MVRIRSIAPFWLVSGFSTRRAAVGTRLFVVLVPIGRGRLFIAWLFLAWRSMRSLVPPEFGPEMLVLLPELFELLNLFPKLLVLFFKRSKAVEYLLFGWL